MINMNILFQFKRGIYLSAIGLMPFTLSERTPQGWERGNLVKGSSLIQMRLLPILIPFIFHFRSFLRES
jgi:hypothetical protein